MCKTASNPNRQRLCHGARQIVFQGLSAGVSHEEIRSRLKSAGHYANLGERTLFRYRVDPVVQEAQQRALQEAANRGAYELLARLEGICADLRVLLCSDATTKAV